MVSSKKIGGIMFSRKLFLAIGLVWVLAVPLRGDAQQGKEIAPGQRMKSLEIEGQWICNAIRTQNNSARPVAIAFHGDGTATFSSATNISNYPGNAGITGRSGNSDGEWEMVGPDTVNFRYTEHLYKGGNAGGRFLVEAGFMLRPDPANPNLDQLCSGNTSTDTCPTVSLVRGTKYVFDQALRDANGNVVDAAGCACMNTAAGCDAAHAACLNNSITGEVDVFNTTGNGVITASVRCHRLNDMTTYGSTTPVFPLSEPCGVSPLPACH